MGDWLYVEISKINHVTHLELLQILCTIESIEDKRWNCGHCLGEHKDKPKVTLAKQKRKGCFGDENLTYTMEQYRLKTCPGNFVVPWVFEYIEMYFNYQRGILPYPGALSEQPAKIMEIFAIIGQKRDEIARENAEKQKAAEKRRKKRSR